MTPQVTVILLTYNHKNYIEKCLESVVNQITNFPFDVVIGDDLSTDGTRLICEKYSTLHPLLLNLLPRQKNLGLAGNLIETMKFARGNFFAFLEGDDSWTDNLKLQSQYDVILNNPDCLAVTHNSEIVYANTRKYLLQNPKKIFTLSDTLKGRIFHTNSWFIKREALPDFSLYYENLICWDILMELKILEQGKVICINKSMSVWRRHEDGNSVKIPLKEQFLNFEKLYKKLLKEGKFINHYEKTLKNFYAIFALEMVRKDGEIHINALSKAILWQFKTLDFDLNLVPKLLISYFNSSGSKSRHIYYR